MTRGMGRAALIVSAGILISRILGLVRESVMAALLGAGTDAAVYVAAFAIPDILYYLMAGGYLSITFIPILSRHLADDDEAGQWNSFTAIAKPVTTAMVLITGTAMVFSNQLVDAVYVTLPRLLDSDATVALGPSELAQVAHLTRIVLPAQTFFMLGSLLAAVQYAHRRFALPSLAPLVYNLAIIIGGALGPSLGLAGPEGFAWGALAGAALGNFGLQLYGARQVGLRWVKGIAWRTPVMGEYLRLAIPLMLGQSIAVLDAQFIPIFGQTLGESTISQLYYGRRLNMFPVGIIAQAAGVAAYPYLARLSEEGKLSEMSEVLTRALRYTIFAGFGAAAAVYAAAAPAVRLAYQRGDFLSSDTVAVSVALTIYSFSIPLWGAHQVYSRGFYARRKMWTPVAIGTLWTVAGAGIYWWLVGRYGALGLATASVVTMALYTLHLGAAWHRQRDVSGFRNLLGVTGRSALAAAAAGAAGLVIVRFVTGPAASISPLGSVAGLGVATIVVGGIFLAGTRLMGGTEMSELRVARSVPD